MELSTRTEIWVERVAAWRASGERAEDFSRKQGYAAGTLRWWASKLKREMAAPAPVQLARVVRTPSTEQKTQSGGVIVLEVVDAGVRIAVERGADASTLAMVLDVVRARSGGRR
jgi:hypothetical protein